MWYICFRVETRLGHLGKMGHVGHTNLNGPGLKILSNIRVASVTALLKSIALL